MTIASCGSVSATTLGLPNSTAIPAEKSKLPKGLFVAKIPVSAKTKQRLANDIESITMLSLLQARNTKLAAGTRVPEILVIGLRLYEPNAAVPTDIVELIAMQRKSGMLFVCVRDADFEGTTRQECAFAVRRALPARAGHTTTSKVFASDWQPAGEATLNATDPAVDSMDALWGVAMLAGDSGRPIPHRLECTSRPTHADRASHCAGRQAHPRPSACQESRATQ